MSIDKVVAMQVIQRGTDAIISEHFNYKLLNAIRRDTATTRKRVVKLMDNATNHKSHHSPKRLVFSEKKTPSSSCSIISGSGYWP